MAQDKNRDHEISAREIRGASKALLKLDENHAGILDEAELRPPHPDAEPGHRGNDAMPPPPPPPPLLTALDAYASGDLSAEEIAVAPAALRSLDTNHDGKLGSEETRPGPEPPQTGDGPPPGGPRR